MILSDKMTNETDINKIDEEMQKKGWIFLGPILHYEKAVKDQALVYKKENEYIVLGINKNENEVFKDKIQKNIAEKRVKESMIEISKHMLKSSL